MLCTRTSPFALRGRAGTVSACRTYAAGVLLLLRYDRWIVWALGAVLQAMVIAAYFNVASERMPAFETWGITIRVLQIALLVVLVALAIGRPRGSTRRPPTPDVSTRRAVGRVGGQRWRRRVGTARFPTLARPTASTPTTAR